MVDRTCSMRAMAEGMSRPAGASTVFNARHPGCGKLRRPVVDMIDVNVETCCGKFAAKTLPDHVAHRSAHHMGRFSQCDQRGSILGHGVDGVVRAREGASWKRRNSAIVGFAQMRQVRGEPHIAIVEPDHAKPCATSASTNGSGHNTICTPRPMIIRIAGRPVAARFVVKGKCRWRRCQAWWKGDGHSA